MQDFKMKLNRDAVQALVVMLVRFDVMLIDDVLQRNMVVMIMVKVVKKLVGMSMRFHKDVAMQRLYKLSLKPGEAAALMLTLSLVRVGGYEEVIKDKVMYELNGYFA